MKRSKINYLETSILDLLTLMRRPSRTLRVLVVDNHENGTGGVEEILRSWPNISMRSFIPSGKTWPLADADTHDDIILLNDAPRQITGDDMAKLDANGFFGIIASIADDEKPDWTVFHFGKKRNVLGNMNTAMDFVLWMSNIIGKIESTLLH